MNQIPTNRPPSPRPPRPKYQGRPIRLPKKCAPPKALVIATTLTTILLVVSIMVLSIALLVGPTNNFDNDSGGKKKDKEQQNEPLEEDNGIFTTFELPCATPKKNYMSTGMGAAISGINSEYAVLVSLTSNTALASKSADEVIHPASMTKVMTLLVACENAKASNALLTVKQEMLDRRKALGGSGELVENTSAIDPNGDVKKIPILGKSITVEDALYLINYQSDTVSCLMIAEYVAGSEAEFVKLMNKKAQDLGLTNTNFVNCTGLTEKDGRYNKTTCREMAAIMACAMNNAVAKEVITSTERYYVTIYEKGEETPYYLSFYPAWHGSEWMGGQTTAGKVDVLGGKTGFEDVPGFCLVTYGKHRSTGEEYVCVTVGARGEGKGRTAAADARTLYKNYT